MTKCAISNNNSNKQKLIFFICFVCMSAMDGCPRCHMDMIYEGHTTLVCLNYIRLSLRHLNSTLPILLPSSLVLNFFHSLNKTRIWTTHTQNGSSVEENQGGVADTITGFVLLSRLLQSSPWPGNQKKKETYEVTGEKFLFFLNTEATERTCGHVSTPRRFLNRNAWNYTAPKV